VDEFQVDSLRVKVYADRQLLGLAAGLAAGRELQKHLAEHGSARLVFAAAPSQQEFLSTLAAYEGIGWDTVTALHLDEYVGLTRDAPQRFGNWLDRHIFGLAHPGTVHYLNGNAEDIDQECRRYEALLREAPLAIGCLGIGENGHLAFNDPPVADFQDPALVKVITLDQRSREQQVHDGCFAHLEEVPTHALTLTIPACFSPAQIHCMVPGSTKAEAVKRTLQGPIGEACPATILRRHPGATLYLDRDSAALL
jgi:glucosamine-6-phosphate deaminase